MLQFSALLVEDVKTAIVRNFSEIKTMSEGFNLHKQVVKSLNFCLVEEDNQSL